MVRQRRKGPGGPDPLGVGLDMELAVSPAWIDIEPIRKDATRYIRTDPPSCVR